MLTQQPHHLQLACASGFAVATCPSPLALVALLLSMCLLTRRSLRGVPLRVALWQRRSLCCFLFPYGLPEVSPLSGPWLRGPPLPNSVSILGLSLGQSGMFPTPTLTTS